MADRPAHLEPAPGSTAFDQALTVAKLGAMAFPPVGAGVALFDLITAPLRGKRLNDWCEQLRLNLNELSEKVAGLTPETLAASEEFNSAFTQAAQAAIKTHQEVKLEALRNTVLNVAVGSATGDEDLQSIFLSLIDNLTPLHIRLLRQFGSEKPISVGTAPEWLKASVCNQAATDLFDRGLVAQNTWIKPERTRLITEESGQYAFNAGLTPFGRQLLSFITAPKGTNGN